MEKAYLCHGEFKRMVPVLLTMLSSSMSLLQFRPGRRMMCNVACKAPQWVDGCHAELRRATR